MIVLMAVFAILATLSSGYGNVIQDDDMYRFLPSFQAKSDVNPDETEINNAEEQLREIAVDHMRAFDTSKCEPCGVAEAFERNQHGDTISCKCVRDIYNQFAGDMRFKEPLRPLINQMYGKSKLRGITSLQRLYWPKNANNKVVVPYLFRAEVPQTTRDVVNEAMNAFAVNTCIRFKKRQTEDNFVQIIDDKGCWSYVGKTGGRQELSLGKSCAYIGVVEHELMHVLGFFHEQSRPDRDNYIKIVYSNIISQFSSNFDKLTEIDTQGTKYDLGSVMHYGVKAFSTNNQDTMIPLENDRSVKIGQRDGFSALDLQEINKKYCSGFSGITTEPSLTTVTAAPTTVTTTPNTVTTCKNIETDRNCDYWVELGYCRHTYVTYVTKYCKGSCGLCGTSTTKEPTVESCKNKAGDATCKKYLNLCQNYKYWMTANCAKACRFCASADSSTTTPQVRSSTTQESYIVDDDSCGKRKITESSDIQRIVGGVVAEPGTIPWQVSLRFGPGHVSLCGASLIGRQWILTAAHCAKQGYVKRPGLWVYLGLHEKNPTKKEGPHHILRKIVKVIRHPEYNDKTMENDLALLELQDPVEYTNYILPVCLTDESNEPSANTDVTISGWGDTVENGLSTVKYLMEVGLKVVDNKVCNRWIGNGPHVSENMLCAGYEGGKKDSCQGDSGGPLTFSSKEGTFYQVGVVSWGLGCARPMRPGVYTRVSKYRDWIRQISGV